MVDNNPRYSFSSKSIMETHLSSPLVVFISASAAPDLAELFSKVPTSLSDKI